MDNRNDKTLNRLVQLGLGLLISLLLTSQAQAAKELLFIHNDHLGTPQVVTNMDQTVVWEGKRKPFGETEEVVSDIDQPSGFPGQYQDEETGLAYNNHRDYDPSIGRYIQSDPIGLVGGVNTYGYVAANPLSYSDFLGLEITGQFRFDKFVPSINDYDWNVTSVDGGMRREGPQDVYGQIDFLVSGLLSAVVDCTDTDDCGNIQREWSLDGSAEVNNLKFSYELKEPFIPIAPVKAAIVLEMVLGASRYYDQWRSEILSVGKKALNSPTSICKGMGFTKLGHYY